MHDALANPMWASLNSTHAGFALSSGALQRFQPDVAPFCAVAAAKHPAGRQVLPATWRNGIFLGTFPALLATGPCWANMPSCKWSW
ncbi:hypothetical protein LP420_20565 [Massilia sp. B-10]|nr:hypothetical protein LP420_20565 [Massilia sp. B-10]